MNNTGLLRFVRALATRLRGRLAPARGDVYRPALDEEEFFGHLDYARHPALHTLRERPAGQVRTRACNEYFRARPAPRFVAGAGAMSTLVARYREQHPGWGGAAIERSHRAFAEGWRTFARQDPPLRPGFPWGELAPGPGGDRLYCKQVHRFAFLPDAAKAAALEARAAPELLALLRDWAGFASGANNAIAYDSNLTVIQRVVALTWAWYLLGAREREDRAAYDAEEFLLLRLIAADVRFLEPRLGDSYPNNHLLADGFGGWWIALLWPEFLCGARRIGDFERLWWRELRRQVYCDGTSFEHSTHYHEYACEMLCAYLVLNAANGRETPHWVRERAEGALRLQTDLAGPECVSLALGDAVEDMLFPLDGGRAWTPGAWRAAGRRLFGWALAAPAPGEGGVEKAFWLLGGDLEAPSPAPFPAPAPEPGPRAFRDGGYYVLNEGDGATRLVFRTGPAPGRALCAGHMHADLLSVYASVAGHAVIGASGTCSYRLGGEVDWRRYFMGPGSHNTLVVAARDPLGTPDTDFRAPDTGVRVDTGAWLDGSALTLVEGRLQGGSQDGRRRGVVHVRGDYWLVYDTLPPALRSEPCQVRFQLVPGAAVGPAQVRATTVTAGPATLGVSATAAALDVCRGDRAGPCGWVSPRYGERVAAPQLIYDVAAGTSVTAFVIAPGAAAAAVSLLSPGPGWIGFEVVRGEQHDTLLLNAAGDSPATQAGAVRFDGRLLWLRRRGGRMLAARWLQGRSLDAEGLRLRADGVSQWMALGSDAGAGLQHDAHTAVHRVEATGIGGTDGDG